MATIEEAIENAENKSLNWLAHMLTHRASVHIYCGKLKLAYGDLKQSVELFESMDDALGLLKARLTWGYEYCQAQNDWPAAQQQLVQVGEIIGSQKAGSQMHMPEAARLWLGLCQTALYSEQLAQAKDLLGKAMRVIDLHHLDWWRPTGLYLNGLILMKEANGFKRAQHIFKTAVNLSHESGNPDELPLLLWQLAIVTDDQEKKSQLLEACVTAAQKRSRYFDKLACFQAIGPLLLESEDPQLHQLGGDCMAFVDSANV